MRRGLAALLAAGLAWGADSDGARAELYQWVDAHGRVHVTDDVTQVPPDQRESARWEADRVAPANAGRWNRLEQPSPVHRVSPRTGAKRTQGRTHVLKVQRAGREIRIPAILNGGVTWPYVVDTGASLNTLPRAAAERLGITIDESAPRTLVAGIGGQAMSVPVVTLRSVQIGSAMVENVEMAVLDTMDTGLLGMPFFNHFRVALDPSLGVLTLQELDLETVEGIHGGLDESVWRSRFRQVRYQLDHVRASLARMPVENVAQIADLERQEAYWDQQLQALELKATRAGVPRAWRD